MTIATEKLAPEEASTSAVRRRWRIPPPLIRDPDAPGPEGLLLLQEVRGDEGLALWHTLRNVLLWSRTPPSDRKGLFVADALDRRLAFLLELRLPARLHEPLSALARLLDTPQKQNASLVALNCVRVHDWARDQGYPVTSLEYLQAAAVASPGEGRIALALGRELRDRNLHGRAEAWFLRAIGLTRQARDWDSYTQTYNAYGYMMIHRGNFPLARRLLTKAARRADRQGLREARGRAYHDLFVVEAECGEVESAQRYAQKSLESYSPGHPNLPALAHDVAYFWMEHGGFAQALPVLESVLPHLPDRHAPACLGALARTQGALGDRAGFAESLRLLRARAPGFGLAQAWCDAGHGALSLGMAREAEAAATRSLQLAEESGEGKVRFAAESLLGAATARPVGTIAGVGVPAGPESWQSANTQMAEALAGEFVISLTSAS